MTAREFLRRKAYVVQHEHVLAIGGDELIQIHPMADDPREDLRAIGVKPSDCSSADFWWHRQGKVALLQIMGKSKPYVKAGHYDGSGVFMVGVKDKVVTRPLLRKVLGTLSDDDVWKVLAPRKARRRKK